MIRALLVTSSDRLRTVLESVVEVAAVVPSIEEAVSLATELNPDLIVAEADFEEFSELASASIPVLLLTADPPSVSMNDALRAGLRGILPRDSSASEIDAAIRAVAAGLNVFHPQATEALRGAPADSGEPLSRREIEVLRLMGEGLSNKIIAWRLSISEHTVKFHVNSILSKLNAGSRTEAVMIGLRRGLVPL